MQNRKGKRRFLAILIITGVLLGGCGTKEISKTVILPKETADDGNGSGINVKNIKEHTYEGDILSMTWEEDLPGGICVLFDKGGGWEYQVMDVYQKETLESSLLDEFFVGFARISPGGKYIISEVINDSVVQLFLYRTGTGEKQLICEWENSSEIFMYEWSGDGTKFFVWQDGNDYGQDPYENWSICRYDAESGEKAEILMEGNGGAWRTVLPNDDGSKAYVREEYIDENCDVIMNMYEGTLNKYKVTAENTEYDASTGEDEQTAASRSWVADMETGEARELEDEKMIVSGPIKYTRQGVFGKEGDGIWLLQEPLGEKEKKRILTTDCDEICVCENGDHIFLMDWDMDPDYLQVTGVRMQDGEVAGRQVLYKNIYGSYDTVLVGQDDSELIIQTEEYLSKEECLKRVAVLEY